MTARFRIPATTANLAKRFLLIATFCVPAFAQKAVARDFDLRCVSILYAGKPWVGNVTFLQVKESKSEVLLKDMSERTIGWQLLRIYKKADGFIHAANTLVPEDDPSIQYYVIDRVTGIMELGSYNLGDVPWYSHAKWQCEPYQRF